ncbi:hypothetical protein ACHAXT_004672 [Thalassiosira profunda]
MSSPKASLSNEARRRPGTPHHPSEKDEFDFPAAGGPAPDCSSLSQVDGSDGGRPDPSAGQHILDEHRQDVPSGGCVGISLATVMNTIRDPLSTRSLPSSPHSTREDDRSPLNPFQRFRSALRKSLSCADGGKSHPTDTSHDVHCVESYGSHLECDTFGDKSLTQRAASWGTQETFESPRERMKAGIPLRRSVHFAYPPITSLRLRPRTRSEDVHKLFFAPEELEEYEDDRYDTRLADDVETLAVGSNEWNSMPACTTSTLSADSHDPSSGLPLNSPSNVMFDGSPRKEDGKAARGGKKRFVRGVQIMLREKSTR